MGQQWKATKIATIANSAKKNTTTKMQGLEGSQGWAMSGGERHQRSSKGMKCGVERDDDMQQKSFN